MGLSMLDHAAAKTLDDAAELVEKGAAHPLKAIDKASRRFRDGEARIARAAARMHLIRAVEGHDADKVPDGDAALTEWSRRLGPGSDEPPEETLRRAADIARGWRETLEDGPYFRNGRELIPARVEVRPDPLVIEVWAASRGELLRETRVQVADLVGKGSLGWRASADVKGDAVDFRTDGLNVEPEIVPDDEPPITDSVPGKKQGRTCFGGTRITVDTLFNWLASGGTMDSFLDNFDMVSREQAVKTLRRAGRVMTARGPRFQRELRKQRVEDENA